MGLQGAPQRRVGERIGCQRLDHRRRIGAIDGVVERRGEVDGLRRQILIIHAIFDWHGAAGERVGIGQNAIRHHELALDRRQRRQVAQERGVKQVGVEPVLAGPQHGIDQRLRLRLARRPDRLEIVPLIELPQQRAVQLLARDGESCCALDAVPDVATTGGGARRRWRVRRLQ